MRRCLNIFALVSCLLFLIGNVYYDQFDTPESPVDYRVFYIPLALMVFSLILLAKEYAKLQGKVIQVCWGLFFWLSVGWLIKFCLFNPFLKTINDYVYLGMIIIYGITELKKKK